MDDDQDGFVEMLFVEAAIVVLWVVVVLWAFIPVNCGSKENPAQRCLVAHTKENNNEKE